MPLPFRPGCMPSAFGVLPHGRVDAVWELVFPRLRQLPPLPLLAGEGEQLQALAIAGFPGASFTGEQLQWNSAATYAGLDMLYVTYLRHDRQSSVHEWHAVRAWQQHPELLRSVRALSLVQFGPFSTALALINEDHESALSDPVVIDAVVKHATLRLSWQADALSAAGKPLVQWLYEPYLEVVGSPFVPLEWEHVRGMLEETFAPIRGVRAVWAGHHAVAPQLLVDDTVEVLGLRLPDPEQLDALVPSLKAFLRRKGVIAWGIVPVTPDGLRSTTLGRLTARFGRVLQSLEDAGLSTEEVVQASIIMPEDTLDHLLPAQAERALTLTADLAALLRQAYDVDD